MSMRETRVSVRNGAYDVAVYEGGEGDTVLYLHGGWDQPPNAFCDELARSCRVVAPVHLGFEGSSSAADMLEFSDALYYHLDLLDALQLQDCALIGHSLGGMFAAELAAVQPQRFRRLVLISPLGLWDAARPAMDFFAAQPAKLSAALYHDGTSPAAVEAARTPQDEDELVTHILRRSKSMATQTRYLWPLPDRGLARRAHRINAPTLVVWGADDGVCPVSYGDDFVRRITGSRLVTVDAAGHEVHLERVDEVIPLVTTFLGVARTQPVHAEQR
jgi:pimeloyl-ACP methyl ester carboxylesterase